MNQPKYIREKLNGELVYPVEIKEIKSKEDIRRWFEWSCQFESGENDYKSFLSFLEKLKIPYRRVDENGRIFIYVKFPRCKYESVAR